MVKCNILLLAILISSIFCISPIFASVLVDLNSPANETITSNNTPNFNFTVSGSESFYNCSLYLNNINKGNNATTVNNTATIITSTKLGDGFYEWCINCTAGGIMNQSEARTFVIYECPECNDSCLSEWQNQTIYDIYNQTGLIYNFNVTNTMNPSFVLWILIFLGSTMALLYGVKIKKVAYLIVSTVLYLTLSIYSFSFIEIIGDAGTWIMIGISVLGFSVGLLYTLQAVVILLKESSSEPKEVVKL